MKRVFLMSVPAIAVLIFFGGGLQAQNVVLPEVVNSQVVETEVPQGFTEGLKDGSLVEINSGLWLLAGCLLPLPGVIISAAYSPSFNPNEFQKISQIKGESYAMGYAKAYETKARNMNYQTAWNGFGVALLIGSIINFVNTLSSASTLANPDAMTNIPVPLIQEQRYDTR